MKIGDPSKHRTVRKITSSSVRASETKSGATNLDHLLGNHPSLLELGLKRFHVMRMVELW